MPYKDPAAKKAHRAKWHAENYHGQRRVDHIRDKVARRKELQRFVAQLKIDRGGCNRCPEQDPVCLDFHHAEGKKESALSQAPALGWSKDRIRREAEKCEVICANCHRKQHGKERGLRPEAKTSAFQADDTGSSPVARSTETPPTGWLARQLETVKRDAAQLPDWLRTS